ncbi:MAG: rhomboid family intramembrane serine protease [Pseudobdellovibrionaceae bacterium]
MILPCPADLKNFKQFPLTLTLVVLNVFIFVLIFSGVNSHFSSLPLLENDSLNVTGRIYHQYLKGLSKEALSAKPSWIRELNIGNVDQMEVLGSYALRDGRFMASAETLSFVGDEVRIAEWKKDLVQFRDKYRDQNLYRFGLSASKRNFLSWITYQFSHSNWMHLLSNLMFLVLIGAAVEAVAGSSVLLFIYLLGGLAGGLTFLLWDWEGTVPMVGASASISALLVFYCVAETRFRIRFLYFISPFPGQYGAIYLPTLLIFPLFIAADLSNLWATPDGFGGGIAYSAHLGGAAFGAVAGFLHRVKALPVLTQS